MQSRKRSRDQQAVALAGTEPTASGYVSLNVGGVVFLTAISTLTSEPSKLADMVKSKFAGLALDAQLRPFIDRDPENFRHILNYLRGYELPLSPEEVIFLAEDAEYFGLKNLLTVCGVGHGPRWSFVPGPGVSENGSEFSSSSIVGPCGADFFCSGTHSITFRIEKCDVVGLGLITRAYRPRQQLVFEQRNSLCYLSTGDLTNFINGAADTSCLVRFKEGDIVSILVEFGESSNARVTFAKAGFAGHTIDLPSPVPELRFATFLHGLSVVHIAASSSSHSQQ